MAEISIGLSSVHFEWSDLEDAVVRAKSYGCDGVEWFTNLFTHDECRQIADLSQRHKMEMSYHAPYTREWDMGLTDVATGRRLMAETVTRAHIMGAEIVVAHLGRVPETGLDSAVNNVIAILEAVVDDLERHEITLALENDTFCHYDNPVAVTPEPFLTLFERLPSDRLAMNLDVGHSHVTGNLDEFLARCGDKIAYVHLADNDGTDDQHSGMRDGTVDWEDVFERLGALGFSGGVGIEFNEINLAHDLPLFRGLAKKYFSSEG